MGKLRLADSEQMPASRTSSVKSASCAPLQMSSEIFDGRLRSEDVVRTENEMSRRGLTMKPASTSCFLCLDASLPTPRPSGRRPRRCWVVSIVGSSVSMDVGGELRNRSCGQDRHIWRICRPDRRQYYLSLATTWTGVRELTLICNQAGLRPAQISRPRGFGGLADRSERVTRRMLRGDGMVGAGPPLARPITLVGDRRARIRGCRHRYQRGQKGNRENGLRKLRRHCLLLCHSKGAPCALLQMSSELFVGRLHDHSEVKTEKKIESVRS